MEKRIFIEYICNGACYEGEKAFLGGTIDFILDYMDCSENKSEQKFIRKCFKNKSLTQENPARLTNKKYQNGFINCYWDNGSFVVNIYTKATDDIYQTIDYDRHYIFDVKNIIEIKYTN